MTTNSGSREQVCPHTHETIAKAIRCAERSLGIAPGQKLHPYWGATKQNEGLIVGWQVSGRQRWRLDYESGAAGKGPHVNEENFELPAYLAKTVHLITRPALSGDLMVFLQYRKWTSAGSVDK